MVSYPPPRVSITVIGACVLTFYGLRLSPELSAALADSTPRLWIAGALASLGSVIGVSVGDIFGAALLLWVVSRPGRTRRLLGLGAVFTVLSMITIGLGYSRPGPADRFELDPLQTGAPAEQVIGEVSTVVNDLRKLVAENDQGVTLNPPLRLVDRDAGDTSKRVFGRLGIPGVSTGRTKPLTTSPLAIRYITGIFLPPLAEPTIVWPPYPASLGVTVAHERAHLWGFGGEDEASFAGFLVSAHSRIPEVRYSAFLLLYRELGGNGSGMDPGVVRDLQAIRQHYDRYSGADTEVFRKAHDVALKAAGESDGVASYNRVAELAIRYIQKYGVPEPV